MLVFPAIGLLLWIAFLLVVLVLASILWVLSSLVLWITGLKPRASQKKVTTAGRDPRRVQRPIPDPAPTRAAPPVRDRALRPAPAPASPDIWPKWTPAHRRYVDEELALWQEQFDALNSKN
ncbi:hypothetical protein NG697_00520 [Pseudarthrobacter sp. MDT3-26]|uniref:hypothetical protein n=1 Tax=Pseudarthrobacter raffinosi TaxID=2953651 RepID=UPI00208DE33A|nr:hypothetical protein [Pseudarthrobacter sp. MDT3-26]MCO4261443.1 hypothetical protein [Pseudarthrobacter sp. MDT3-26]